MQRNVPFDVNAITLTSAEVRQLKQADMDRRSKNAGQPGTPPPTHYFIVEAMGIHYIPPDIAEQTGKSSFSGSSFEIKIKYVALAAQE